MVAESISSCGGYWSPIVASGPESTLSGVLAGFVFTGIIVVLSTSPNSEHNAHNQSKQRSYALQLFLAAFIVLALDSYFTSISAGELACNRAYAEAAVSGGILGVGAILLLTGLRWLVTTYSDSAGEVVTILTFITASVWVVIVLMLAASAMGVGQAMLPGRGHNFVNRAPWILAGAIAIAVVIAVIRARGMGEQTVAKAVRIAALTGLGAAIFSATFTGLASTLSASWWAHPPTEAVNITIVLSMVVPAVALVSSVPPAVAAVVGSPSTDDHAESSPLIVSVDKSALGTRGALSPHRAGPSGIVPALAAVVYIVAFLAGRKRIIEEDGGSRKPISQSQSVLEPMDHEILAKRTSDTFPAGYLTSIAIIQGVALGILVTFALPRVLEHGVRSNDRIMLAGQAITGLAAIVIVSYEYLWFTTIMRWVPRFFDTLVPYVLGVGEIAPPLLIKNNAQWWIAMTAFLAAAAFAFYYTISRSSEDMFPGKPAVYRALRQLLRRLIICCLFLACISATITVVNLSSHHLAWLMTMMPWAVDFAGVLMVVISERTLTSVYHNYGIMRGKLNRTR